MFSVDFLIKQEFYVVNDKMAEIPVVGLWETYTFPRFMVSFSPETYTFLTTGKNM